MERPNTTIKMQKRRKLPKGLSESERLEDLFDKGFERIKLRNSRRNSRRTPYTVRMEIITENGRDTLQTVVYDRNRKGCKYIGKLRQLI